MVAWRPPRARLAASALSALLVGLVGLAGLAGCSDLRRGTGTATKLPGGAWVPQSVSTNDQVWVALSTATPALSPRLLDQLGQVIVPEAISRARHGSRPVSVVVYAMGENTAGLAQELATVTYDHATSDSNSLVVQRQASAATNSLFSQLSAAMRRRRPAATEDVPGALWLLAQDVNQVPDAQHHVLGVLLGDDLSSVDTCNTTVLPAADDQQVDAAARECLAGTNLELNGIPVWLDGIGLDPTGGQLSATQLDRARQILVRMVQLAGGQACRAGPLLLADPNHC